MKMYTPNPAFWYGCVPLRLTLVALFAFGIIPINWFQGFALLASTIAISFWAIFLFGWRKTGIETRGKPIWWNHLRPVHGTIWGLVAFYAWNKSRELVWLLLLLDVAIGLAGISFMNSTT